MKTTSFRSSRSRVLLALILSWLAPCLGAQEVQRLAPEERAEIDLMLRRGELREARAICEEILAEDPGDAATRVLSARCAYERCDYDEALSEGRRALREAVEDDVRRAAARFLARVTTDLGRAGEALSVLEDDELALRPDDDSRDAWALAAAHFEAGHREEALAALRRGAQAEGTSSWDALLGKARCQRGLGDIRATAATLVAADRVAGEADGAEPDVLVLLGDVYFEAYGEVDDAVSLAHSPAELYREALEIHPRHEGARLGLFELGRFNWMRRRTPPAEHLQAVLEARADSVPGLLAAARSAVEDGALPVARERLGRLRELAPERRAVRTVSAALAWVEHDRAAAEATLAELLAEDSGDGVPEREVGRHLIALYRFSEAAPFLERAVQRDPLDFRAWKELGHALANTGDEKGALEALTRAKEAAAGRRDAWRDNTSLVLERIAGTMIVEEGEDLSFAWRPDAAFVLQTYLEPFYAEAREELAMRYGFTPDPVRIEVFRRWNDFSVRSTGFEGFPALGVCFGPVVTAVSPLAEMRGGFSWARTSFHEFTHVIHLGLSHNRCPRWITEGLATWEEGRKNKAWWRNMRRDLIDARANGDIVPLRQLNETFRGPRVLFAYYQSGLICKMLVEQHGFPPMVRLLEAFDRGEDLDTAFGNVFGSTPEEIDADFQRFVDAFLQPLVIEPRWSPASTFRRRLALSRRPPEEGVGRGEWARDWCRVAWGFRGEGKYVDAEEALRIAARAGELPPRGLFLRAELAFADGDAETAVRLLRAGFEAGGEEFRARMTLGHLLGREGDVEGAEEQFLAAERDFPGFDDPGLSAELALAELYDGEERTEEAMEARLRWLGFNAGDYNERARVARWLADEGRHAEAVELWREANEVDPFRRQLHYHWGLSLAVLGRHEEAQREFEVGLRIPWELELEALSEPEPSWSWTALEPELYGERARSLLALGQGDEAREAAEAALALDPECVSARETLTALGGETPEDAK